MWHGRASPSVMPPQVPVGCLREKYEELKEKTKNHISMYAGQWVRITKVIRDVGGGQLVEREFCKEYGTFVEVGVLGDYEKAIEMGAYALTSEVTRDDHPIGGSLYPGVYELQQGLRKCSDEEWNMVLVVEVEDDVCKDKALKTQNNARKNRDQVPDDVDDTLQEKLSKYPRIVRRWPHAIALWGRAAP